MSLSMKAVDRLFARLAATYGAAWDRNMGSAPIADVKTAWAHELAGFASRMQDVAWALENLPERCPNVIEFRNLCRHAPRDTDPQLPSPKADPERAAAELAKLRPMVEGVRLTRTDGKDWARRLIARHDAGEKLRQSQLQSARMALGIGGGAWT